MPRHGNRKNPAATRGANNRFGKVAAKLPAGPVRVLAPRTALSSFRCKELNFIVYPEQSPLPPRARKAKLAATGARKV
jgi:hypothetical protein